MTCNLIKMSPIYLIFHKDLLVKNLQVYEPTSCRFCMSRALFLITDYCRSTFKRRRLHLKEGVRFWEH